MKTDHGDVQHKLDYPVIQPYLLLPFLLEHCGGKSRNHIKSMLSRGQVMVNGCTVTQFDRPLTVGETVTVLGHVSRAPGLPFEILYEDDELIVIDKPAGLLSVATDREKASTVYRILTDYVRRTRSEARIHVVHRLDRDTSGILLFAKSRSVKLAFQENWNSLVKTRGYLTVVEGVPEKEKDTVRSFLHETSTHLVYSGKPGGGLEAVTRYTLLERNGGYSLLDVEIDTGRKNQIRVHMKELGHPVVGDKKYGAESNPLGRLGLHAAKLMLVHPLTGREFRFTAKAPTEFKRFFRL